MSEKKLGIIGGGQLGSMLSQAAKKLNIKTIVYTDDKDAPAQNFCDEFIVADYKEKNKEEIKRKGREYYHKNKEQEKIRKKEYREKWITFEMVMLSSFPSI